MASAGVRSSIRATCHTRSAVPPTTRTAASSTPMISRRSQRAMRAPTPRSSPVYVAVVPVRRDAVLTP